jgi:hypothetical protein
MEALLRRREQLIEQCEAQRSAIAAHVGGLDKPIALADRVLGGVRYLRSHPLLLGTATAAIVALRGRGLWKWGRHAVAQRGVLLKWGQRGILAWRAWRALRGRRVPT